jgi:ParB/RepB/Spo0J family partition protein
MNATAIHELEITTVHPDPHQPRKLFDDDKQAELAASIKANGLLYPITVHACGGYYQIVDGERRYRALVANGEKTVPCLIVATGDAQDTQLLQIVANLQREGLTLAETSASVTALCEQIGAEATAERLGKSLSWVSKRRGLLDVPALKPLIESGKLNDAEMARDLVTLQKVDAEAAADLLDCIAAPEMAHGHSSVTREDVKEAITRAKAVESAPPLTYPTTEQANGKGTTPSATAAEVKHDRNAKRRAQEAQKRQAEQDALDRAREDLQQQVDPLAARIKAALQLDRCFANVAHGQQYIKQRIVTLFLDATPEQLADLAQRLEPAVPVAREKPRGLASANVQAHLKKLGQASKERLNGSARR